MGALSSSFQFGLLEPSISFNFSLLLRLTRPKLFLARILGSDSSLYLCLSFNCFDLIPFLIWTLSLFPSEAQLPVKRSKQVEECVLICAFPFSWRTFATFIGFIVPFDDGRERWLGAMLFEGDWTWTELTDSPSSTTSRTLESTTFETASCCPFSIPAANRCNWNCSLATDLARHAP